MTQEESAEYLLGTNREELARLEFQHSVWKPVTEKFFDRLNVRSGWHCLDVGAGPGFVASDLRERVGAKGSVTILEPSKFYLEWFQQKAQTKGWTNMTYIQGTAETAQLPDAKFDLIFIRWVISFVPDAEQFLRNLASALKPGGIIAIQDYYYEALSLYPHGAFNSVADIMRSYYQTNGGNAYVIGQIPALFRKLNMKMIDCTPNCLAGGPQSGVTEWAGRFFTMHLPIMAEKGFITAQQRDTILNDWNEHRTNPDMLFFSPLVVDIAGILQ